MAWIHTIPPDAADGPLKEEYDEALKRSGHVAHVVRLSSLNPAALRAWVGLYKVLMFGPSPLSRVERELTATVVSQENRCHYWVYAHAAALRSEAKGREAWADRVRAGWRQAELAGREEAIASFAAKLTLDPYAMREGALEPLRRAGLDDRAILDLTHVVGFFAHANRLADALGCDLEASMPPHPGAE